MLYLAPETVHSLLCIILLIRTWFLSLWQSVWTQCYEERFAHDGHMERGCLVLYTVYQSVPRTRFVPVVLTVPQSINQSKVPCLSWNPKINFNVLKCLPLEPILRQIIPFHILTSYFFKFNFNITFSATTTSTKWPVSFKFSTQYFYVAHACYIPCPSQPPSFHHPNIC
jgi:hypothetical protein